MMIERDLARWMAVHSAPGEAVVLAPPDETISMYYYGGVRGVATLGWENRDGLGRRSESSAPPAPTKPMSWWRGAESPTL